MSDHKSEFDAKCTSCKGTGVVAGTWEKGGIAVVCHTCKGTGAVHRVIEWDDAPNSPLLREGISWIVQCNPGIGLVINDQFPPGSFGGMSYEDWRAGKLFVRGMEMRQSTCPQRGWPLRR